MDSFLSIASANLHWIALATVLCITVSVFARHKQRRQKKLLKVLKRHGVLDNQQRFQN